MSNKIFKNYQVNMGMPFQVKSLFNFDTIKKINIIEAQEKRELDIDIPRHDPDEIINKARDQAEAIIEEAKLEAQKILEMAENELNDLKRSVEEEAWQKGYEEGLNEAKRQCDNALQEAQLIREEAKVAYENILKNAEADTVEVILDIARKVIGAEISFNKENILYLVKQAFEKCTNKEHMVLKVSIEDYEYIMDNMDRFRSMLEGISEFEVKKDASMKAGDCIVETSFGTVDAGVNTRLEKIEEAFRKLVCQ